MCLDLVGILQSNKWTPFPQIGRPGCSLTEAPEGAQPDSWLPLMCVCVCGIVANSSITIMWNLLLEYEAITPILSSSSWCPGQKKEKDIEKSRSDSADHGPSTCWLTSAAVQPLPRLNSIGYSDEQGRFCAYLSDCDVMKRKAKLTKRRDYWSRCFLSLQEHGTTHVARQYDATSESFQYGFNSRPMGINMTLNPAKKMSSFSSSATTTTTANKTSNTAITIVLESIQVYLSAYYDPQAPALVAALTTQP